MAQNGSITGEVATKSAKLRGGVLVHLTDAKGDFSPPEAPVTMDQKGMTFLPHILPVLKGTTVRFVNSDSVRHNVFSPDGDKYDLGSWPKGEAKTHRFQTTGTFQQLCNVHPEMGAYVVVLDNPFFALTDKSGKFKIDGIPAGTYTIRAWSDKGGETTKSVTVAADAAASVKLELR